MWCVALIQVYLGCYWDSEEKHKEGAYNFRLKLAIIDTAPKEKMRGQIVFAI